MEHQPTQQELEAADFARALAQDLATDLADASEEELEVLTRIARATINCLGKTQHLRGARWVMEQWLTVIQSEDIRRGFQAESEAAELKRLFALETR